MTEGVTETNTEGAAVTAPSAPSGSGPGLDLIALTKVFPGGTVAVDDVNLHVDHGEYVVLLGPSGCGKTTTLRMIGGHEYPTEGQIVLDGQSLVDLPPHKRPTTTVFQHFALFPHRSVLDNVAFGLKMEGMGKEARRTRAMEALEMVGLSELQNRKPAALSGGQQQRVALARRLVIEDEAHVQVSVPSTGGPAPAVGEQALVAIRAAAVEVGETGDATPANSARCEIIFVEFLGDLVKLHLMAGGERMLAKVPGERYPDFRGREGETILISWKEEDVQLLHS